MARSRVGGSSLALAGITALAAVLRFATLARPNVDNDEAYTSALASHTLWGMLRLFRFEADGLLYPLVAWPIAHVIGGTVALRLPAAIAGTLTVPIVYLIGCELVSRRLALLGAALVAVDANAIYVSQYARAYAFVLLLGSLSYLALLRAMHGGRRAWLAYAAVTALAGYAQLLALALLPLGQLVFVLGGGRRTVRSWLRALALGALLATPMLALAAVEASSRNPLGWLGAPGLSSAVDFVSGFTVGAADTRVAADGTTHLFKPVVVVPALWILIIVVALLRSRRPSHRWLGDPIVGLVGWTAIPPAVLFVVSQVKPLFYPTTYLTTSLPGACLLVAAAVGRLPGRWRLSCAAVLVAIGLAASIVATVRPPATANRAVARWLVAHRTPATPLVLDPAEAIVPLGYYDPALRSTGGRIIVPEWKEAPLPRSVFGYEPAGSYTPGILSPPTRRTLAPILARSADHSLDMVLELGVNLPSDGLDSPGVRWLESECVTREVVYTGIVILAASRCRGA